MAAMGGLRLSVWTAMVCGLMAWAGLAGTSGAQAAGVDLAITSASGSFVSWSPSLVQVNVGVVNQGTDSAGDVALTFVPPAGVTLVAASIATRPCAAPAADGSVRCPVGQLGAGVQSAASVTAVNTGLASGSDVTLQTQISSASLDTDPLNDVRLVPLLYAGGPIPTQPGVPTAQLTLGQPVLGTTGTGSVVSIDLPLGNAGPSDALGVRVVFGLSAGTTPSSAFISAATPPCPFDEARREVTCTLPRPVGAGSQESVHLSVFPAVQPDGAAPTVTVQVIADTLDLVPADNLVTVALAAPSPGQGAAIPVVVDADRAALPFTGGRASQLFLGGLTLLGLGCCLVATTLFRWPRSWRFGPPSD
ncbi:MAG: hypothetical protein IT196_18705 [Acidimicrobiales bacterium]|nr:hypothetical protein [Acidimicrobiales bacterium]